jgi:hypothetical protein
MDARERRTMRKVARQWIARIMVTWGMPARAMVLVPGEISFCTVPALLGTTGAGFFPATGCGFPVLVARMGTGPCEDLRHIAHPDMAS